jgi:hypothetical protein
MKHAPIRISPVELRFKTIENGWFITASCPSLGSRGFNTPQRCWNMLSDCYVATTRYAITMSQPSYRNRTHVYFSQLFLVHFWGPWPMLCEPCACKRNEINTLQYTLHLNGKNLHNSLENYVLNGNEERSTSLLQQHSETAKGRREHRQQVLRYCETSSSALQLNAAMPYLFQHSVPSAQVISPSNDTQCKPSSAQPGSAQKQQTTYFET